MPHGPMFLVALAFVGGAASTAASSNSPTEKAVACVQDTWNAYDAPAARACFSATAVAVRDGARVPIDWKAEAGYRAFDAVARSHFRFTIDLQGADAVEAEMTEENDFLRALGIASVSARWRFVVDGALIVEEEHLRADANFHVAFLRFVEWGQAARPVRWTSILDSAGDVRFDGDTAPHLIELAQQWRAAEGP